MTVPKRIWLYRITHIENLYHILNFGVFTSKSPNANPNYIKIGDQSLIQFRRDLDARNPPGGTLSDYIPFYLGPRSPMLYQIATGYEDIEKHDQENIIYIISSYDQIVSHNLEYFFTDSNARTKTCNYYIEEKDFNNLDWDAIDSTHWISDESDLLRKQKKQSEFLIKHHLPVSCIDYIGVYNESAKQKVLNLLEQKGLDIPIKTSPHKLYYDHL